MSKRRDSLNGKKKARTLVVEKLAMRRMMAADVLAASASGKLWFDGTNAPDEVRFVAGTASHTLYLNGAETQIPAAEFDDIRIRLGNDDRIQISGIEGVPERFKSWEGKTVLTSADFELTVYGGQDITADSVGPESDRAYFYGTEAEEILTGSPSAVNVARPTSQLQLNGFDRMYVYGGGGFDTVELEDGPGDDKFRGYADHDILDCPESYLKMHEFDSVHIAAINGGADRAYQWDSIGDDHMIMSEDFTKFVSDEKTTSTSDFERSYAYSTVGGTDHLKVYDTVFTDNFELDSIFSSTGRKNGYEATPEFTRFFSEDFYRRATHFEMEDVMQVNPRALAGRFSETGAVSVNMDWEAGSRPDFYIEQQRRGADLIMSGLGLDNRFLIDLGITMIQWGIDQQTKDGDFSVSGDELHSITMFMHAVGLSLTELDRYGYTEFTDQMRQTWIQSLDRMADWVVRHQDLHADVNLEPYSHRYFLRAVGFKYAHQFTGKSLFLAESDRYFDEAIIRLTEDSIMPELGRFDLNYQTLGLRYARDYLYLGASADRVEKIVNLFQVSLEVIEPRIDANGIANLSDSSRTGELDREGRVKKFDYRNAVRAYYGGYEFTSVDAYLDLANRVFQHDKSMANALLLSN